MPDQVEIVACPRCKEVLGTGHEAIIRKTILWKQHLIDSHDGVELELEMFAGLIIIAMATPEYIRRAWAATQKVG